MIRRYMVSAIKRVSVVAVLLAGVIAVGGDAGADDASSDPHVAIAALDENRYLWVDAGGNTDATRFVDAVTNPVVDIALTVDGSGYWLVSADGSVITDGSAGFFGSLARVALVAPPVAISPTPSGLGYWLAAADGGVFAFGDAPFLGSLAQLSLAAPIVDLAVTPSGEGYWLAGADGGVFAFGDAAYLGRVSLGENGDAVAIAAARDGSGYRLVMGDADVRFGSLAEQNDAYFLRSGRGRPVDVVALDGPRVLVLIDDGRVTLRGSGRADNQRRIDEARAVWATASVSNYALIARGNWGFFCQGTSLSLVVEGVRVGHSTDESGSCKAEGYTIESLHDWLEQLIRRPTTETVIVFDDLGVPVSLDHDIPSHLDEETFLEFQFVSG